MKNIHVTFKGTTPLLMHSCRSLNHFDPLSIEMAKLNAKKNKKTEEEEIRLSDLEWETGLYWDDKAGRPYVPAENIEATVRDGAKARRKGKEIIRGFSVLDMMAYLDIGENLTKEEMATDARFRDIRPMRVMRNRIMRTRPRFNMWKVGFNAMYDENILSFSDIVDAIEYAGQYVGLCDSRPKYGRFVATIEELD